MAKQSPAKLKMLQAEAKRAAAARRAEKAAALMPDARGDVVTDPYEGVDDAWREIGLPAPARHALIDDGLYAIADLRKVSLAALKELKGITPNAVRILVAEMKKQDIQFRN
jgi:hypothetical protein